MFQRALRDLDCIYLYIYEQVSEYAEEQADRLEAGIFSLEEYISLCGAQDWQICKPCLSGTDCG